MTSAWLILSLLNRRTWLFVTWHWLFLKNIFCVPPRGFEPLTLYLLGRCANHYTTGCFMYNECVLKIHWKWCWDHFMWKVMQTLVERGQESEIVNIWNLTVKWSQEKSTHKIKVWFIYLWMPKSTLVKDTLLLNLSNFYTTFLWLLFWLLLTICD